ncbi:hypothetical protein HBB16_18180 [Pseudonocardia sp. MCCB 268]|nr:hypothetical protein [Pseudonocardia cytotoxica]
MCRAQMGTAGCRHRPAGSTRGTAGRRGSLSYARTIIRPQPAVVRTGYLFHPAGAARALTTAVKCQPSTAPTARGGRVGTVVAEEAGAAPFGSSALDTAVPVSDLVLVGGTSPGPPESAATSGLDHLFEQRCVDHRWPHRPAGRRPPDSPSPTTSSTPAPTAWPGTAAARRVRPQDRVALLIDVPRTRTSRCWPSSRSVPPAPRWITSPPRRLVYIVEDARARTVLSLSHLAAGWSRSTCSPRPAPSWVHLDAVAPLVDELDGRRLIDMTGVQGQPAGLPSATSIVR